MSVDDVESFDGVVATAGIDAVPTPPVGAGSALTEEVREGVHRLLYAASDQLGDAYRAKVAHPALTPTELLPHTSVANVGALSNRLIVVKALFMDGWPGGPSTARQAASSVRALLRHESDETLRRHLTAVLSRLEEIAADPRRAQDEAVDLETRSASLEAVTERRLGDASGVYVYTYPHYYSYPYEPGTERRLFKVGRTDTRAWQRVRAQARSTGAPEEPLLLRVYVVENSTEAERKFHRLLDAAEHDRSSGSRAGHEWFSTTLEFLDEIASALGYEALQADPDTETEDV